jgi:hypothetical protein
MSYYFGEPAKQRSAAFAAERAAAAPQPQPNGA